jgi:hypothetical protein
MKRLIIAALLLASPVIATAATQWYMLKGSTYQCELAATVAARLGLPFYATPYALRLFVHDDPSGHYRDTQVFHTSNGLDVVINTKGSGTYYFSTRKACESYKKAHGFTNNHLNELK